MSAAARPSQEPLAVVLTGASSGIGRAAAIELARRGGDLDVLLTARRAEALDETIALARSAAPPTGGVVRFHVAACDLGTVEGTDALVAAVRDTFGGRLDVLVNNAGVGSDVDFFDADAMAGVDRMLALNLRAPIALTHALTPLLARSARAAVVNVSSVAGLLGTPRSPAYSATKWALTGFSEAMRARLAPLGVRVVCVQPGPVPTPGWPHEWLQGRPIARRVLACDAAVIARAIADGVHGRGGVNPVRPRIYAGIPLLRGGAPWLVRRLLANAARSGGGPA